MPSLPHFAAPVGYHALRGSVAWLDPGPRLSVVVGGDEAAKFVDGFTTAAVARLAAGAGVESFFTDSRGHVLSWATILRTSDGVWIEAEPSLGWSLAAHLERYHIREKLEIVDCSARFAALILAGPAAAEWLAARYRGPLPATPLGHDGASALGLAAGRLEGDCGGVRSAVVRGEWAGPDSFLVRVAAAERERLVELFQAAGLPEADAAAIDAVRREQGRPGVADIPPKTLPQELHRNAEAISFTKGCYLGQETVARLDALGHVNRRFVGVVAAEELRVGAEVISSGEPGRVVGTLTSAGPSPLLGGWLGLGLIRTGSLSEGSEFLVDGVVARWVTLPV
ncbi:MAG: hypothetical protein DWH79_05670 [Planctomycetota bacterium]|nr:MAG: hypothetical protein DWH79_05670 [Planctomycetota bacterium]